jgi:hypothetical protein
MALGRLTATFMPLQLVADVDCEVVFVHVVMLQVLILPMHYVWASKLPKVEVYAFGSDVLTVKRP